MFVVGLAALLEYFTGQALLLGNNICRAFNRYNIYCLPDALANLVNLFHQRSNTDCHRPMAGKSRRPDVFIRERLFAAIGNLGQHWPYLGTT